MELLVDIVKHLEYAKNFNINKIKSREFNIFIVYILLNEKLYFY
jgi:hypothetical protein